MATADPQDVLELEKSLLDGSTRANEALLERLLADEMVEFGKFGAAYDKRSIIEALVREDTAPSRSLQMVDARLFELAHGAVLLAYRLVPTGQRDANAVGSLRSSTWIWRDERWQMLFHQGTAAATSA
jgi:hypothetical protein